MTMTLNPANGTQWGRFQKTNQSRPASAPAVAKPNTKSQEQSIRFGSMPQKTADTFETDIPIDPVLLPVQTLQIFDRKPISVRDSLVWQLVGTYSNALFEALGRGNPKQQDNHIFNYLAYRMLQGAAFPKQQNEAGVSAIQHAASHGNMVGTRLLEEYGVKLTEREANEALVNVCLSGYNQMAQKLLAGIPASHLPTNAMTLKNPFHLAAERGKAGVVSSFLRRPDVNVNEEDASGQNGLMLAAATGNGKTVHRLLDDPRVNVYRRDVFGFRPLDFAAQTGNVDSAKALLSDWRVNVNDRNWLGVTPLMHAAERGHVDMLQELLGQADIEANCQDIGGNTALMLAVGNQHQKAVQTLLGYPHTDVNHRNMAGVTALHRAVVTGNKTLIDMLLARPEIRVNVVNIFKETPLMMAARNGQGQIVEQLLRHPRILVNAGDHDGNTALHHAAGQGYRGATQALLKAPFIRVNDRNHLGQTPLMLAAEANRAEAVKALLKHPEVATGMGDGQGLTGFLYAVTAGSLDAAKVLLAHEPKLLNQENFFKATPLHMAVLNGQKEMLQWLLEQPGIELHRDRAGARAVDYAQSLGRQDMVDLINEKATRSPKRPLGEVEEEATSSKRKRSE